MFLSSPLRAIAQRMLADLRIEAADPDSDLPAHLEYGARIDPQRRRIQIVVFGCSDTEIFTGPDHVDSIVPDLPEILAAFASDYGGEEDPNDPLAAFHVLVYVYDEVDQQLLAYERNTVLTARLGYEFQTH